ncbi:TIGR00180 family glycosyltransferase [Sulfuritalea sp.]|uniref:TIGR00180 family glycosyltransferase n=1 Tax=Sulfuritalea sp. TaxID=2480090 RepID=UPI001ACB7727|nr:TIGR00180 family glycosyltransferase [Sulfuritalea sp.]MBN8473931.1 TIGR00180 family glycosyltransferase [Sulfuritalea sp.]
MKRLTFVLPLKDRPYYSRIWLGHNIRQEHDYLIADGSIANENEELFREVKLPNVTYVRFPQDLSIEQYVEKMVQAVERVQTAYVMTCDNDDFINFQGIASCIDALEKNPHAVCAGGPIYGVSQVVSAASEPRYGMPVRIIDAAALSGMSGFDALVQLFKSYKYMWYSVFRTPSYQRIWSDIRQLQITNVYLVEILQAELVFCHGQYVQVPANHYIRLENPVTSAAREEASMDERHTRKIFFDSEYRDQVEKMSAHVAKLVDVALSQLLHEFTKYFIAGNVQKTDSFVSRMSVRLGRLHEIIPRRLGLSFPIEFGIGFVNGLGKVRSRLGI